MKDRWGVVYCLKGGEWSCLLLKGCLEDFKCKGLQMNPAYIHLTQILQMKRYDKYRLYIKICVCWIVFICPHNSVYFCLPVYFNFIFICLPVYLSKNAGLFHSESVIPVYVSSLSYIFVHIYPSAFQYVCLSIYLLMSIFIVCLFVYMSTCLCLCLSVCISKCIFFYFATQCICLYLCLFVYQCVMFVCTEYMFVYLSTNQYGYVYFRLPMYACLFKSTYQNMSISILFVCLFVYLSTYQYAYVYVCLFVYLLICLCICLSVCLFVYLSTY